MRIVDVNGFYAEAGGGVRQYVGAKFAAAARSGHHLTVIAPGAENRIEPRSGGEIRWLAGAPMPFDPRYRLFGGRGAVWEAIGDAAPDVIEASSPWKSATLAASWPGRVARALVFHQDVVAAYGHTLLDGLISHGSLDALAAPWWGRLRRLSARFDVTVAGGEWLAGRLAEHGLANAVAVPFGIEVAQFGPERRDEDLRAELLAKCGVATDQKLLLAVARFHPEKRLPTLIDAFARARRTRGDLGLVIVGHGLAHAAVERAARRAGHAALLGSIESRETLARIYASADLFIHGSGAETYGLAVAEAAASGLAIVVPDRGGAAHLAPSAWSRIYRTGDSSSCAAAILGALGGELKAPTATPPGALDDHFTTLFDLYAGLSRSAPR